MTGNCANIDAVYKPWDYRDQDIKISKSYESRRQWVLVSLSVVGYHCDGPTELDSPFLAQWFAVSPQGVVSFLGGGIELIDAGDYDNGGRSELIFSTNAYNRGGYKMCYDDFRKQADFEFSYH